VVEEINPTTNSAQQQARKNYQPADLLELPLPGAVRFVPVIVFPSPHFPSQVLQRRSEPFFLDHPARLDLRQPLELDRRLPADPY
jgi:hypothetical protein